MIPRTTVRLALLLALPLLDHAPLRAQEMNDSVVTARGVCHLWAGIPGASSWPTDATYNRCALDQAPIPIAGNRLPPSPIGVGEAQGSFTVVVNPNGTVDSSLTRASLLGMDTDLYFEFLKILKQWRFTPGTREGKPVRYGVPLEVVTPVWRNDTLAAHLEWSYHTGTLTDTLLGRWIREPDPPPYAEDRVDSVYVAVIRRLVAMQVVTKDRGIAHCLVISGVDSSRHARLSEIARRLVYGTNGGTFAPTGCERDSAAIQLTVAKVHRTESDRVVIDASGDRLLEWPRNLSGQSWKFWRGRCIGVANGRSTAAMNCLVHPDTRRRQWPGGALPETLEVKSAVKHRAATSTNEPFRLRLIVTTDGAYWSDTLQYEMRGPLPRFSERAVTDSLPRCDSWEALSTQQAKDVLVLDADPEGNRLEITNVQHSSTPLEGRMLRSGKAAPRQARLAAFVLGDVGAKAEAPIVLRFPQCGRTYVVDPARHTLAQRAHARFRVGDLREQTRVTSLFGVQVFLHIELDPVPEGVVPLVVFRGGSPARYLGWSAEPISPGIWKNVVHLGIDEVPGYPLESTLSVYLVSR
jgi:hypothetical protein